MIHQNCEVEKTTDQGSEVEICQRIAISWLLGTRNIGVDVQIPGLDDPWYWSEA